MTNEILNFIKEECAYEENVDRHAEIEDYADDDYDCATPDHESMDDNEYWDTLDPAFGSWEGYYRYMYG